MKTAKEMADIALIALSDPDQRELEQVAEQIEQAAKKGRRGLLLARLSAATKITLLKKGYYIQEGDNACSDEFGEYNQISW